MINDELEYQIKAIDQETMTFSNETSRRWKHMIKLNQVYGLSYLTQNNDIEVFTDGKDVSPSDAGYAEGGEIHKRQCTILLKTIWSAKISSHSDAEGQRRCGKSGF